MIAQYAAMALAILAKRTPPVTMIVPYAATATVASSKTLPIALSIALGEVAELAVVVVAEAAEAAAGLAVMAPVIPASRVPVTMTVPYAAMVTVASSKTPPIAPSIALGEAAELAVAAAEAIVGLVMGALPCSMVLPILGTKIFVRSQEQYGRGLRVVPANPYPTERLAVPMRYLRKTASTHAKIRCAQVSNPANRATAV